MRLRLKPAVVLGLVFAVVIAHAGRPPVCGGDGADTTAASAAGEVSGSVESAAGPGVAARNLDAIGATELWSSLGLTGSGQTVAVIDTGVDPLSPGLLEPTGVSRVRRWYDLTGEGVAQAVGPYRSVNGIIEVGGQRLRVSGLRSLTNTFLVGTLPSSITSLINRDVWFVVFDPIVQQQYEAVVIDTDGDLSFGGEPVLYRFNESGMSASVATSTETSISLVVADVRRSGYTVVFGADINGHGTALASITAASGPGSYRGVAPQSSIIAVKALDSAGRGSWNGVVQGVQVSLAAGADIVLVGAVPDNAGDSPEWTAVQKLAQSQGVPIVIPAGNRGPGVGTVTVPGYHSSTLVVGGYLPGASVSAGSSSGQDVWYPWSSAGPLPNGSPGLDLVAPAVTLVPALGYHRQATFATIEGTSASAAYVAGALALLGEASAGDDGSADVSRIVLAVVEGSRPLQGASPVEAGRGRLSLAAAWATYSSGLADTGLVISRKWNGVVNRNGVWLPDGVIGAFPVWVDNFSPFVRSVDLSATADWLRAEASCLGIPAVSQRDIWVYGSSDLPPGFYSAEVVADDPATRGVDALLTVSQAVPQKATETVPVGSPSRFEFSMIIGSLRSVTRQFFRVPHSAEALVVRVTSQGPNAVLSLYNPEGLLVYQGDAADSAVLRVGLPTHGIWQIAVHRNPMVSGALAASCDVEVSFEGLTIVDMGCTLGGQEFILTPSATGDSPESFIDTVLRSTFRVRRSLVLPAQASTTITFPTVQDGVAAISLRLGAPSGADLKAYLYRFSEAESKWIEVAACSTDALGTAQIYYADPMPGRYVAYVEAYGQFAQVYGEIEAMALEAQSADTAGIVASPLAARAPRRAASWRLTSSTPSVPHVLAVRNSDGSLLLGTVARAVFHPLDVPVVQVFGRSPQNAADGVRTVRAWTPVGQFPLDIVIASGEVYYQLDDGRVSSWMREASSLSWALPGGDSRVVFSFD